VKPGRTLASVEDAVSVDPLLFESQPAKESWRRLRYGALEVRETVHYNATL
jgi:hypothetical protein